MILSYSLNQILRIDLFIEKHPLFHREFVFFPFKIVNDRLTRLLNFT